MPYVDQWKFLESIQGVSTIQLDKIFFSLTNLKVEEATASGMLNIFLSNTIEINSGEISTVLTNFLKEELNFFNTDFIIKMNSGRNTFGTKRYFKFIEEVNERAIIPKGFIRKLVTHCIQHKIPYQLNDQRKLLPAIGFSFNTSLKDYQLPAVGSGTNYGKDR